MPTRLTLYYHHMINISTLWVSHFGSESYLISIWALIEKRSSLGCCFKQKRGGYEVSFCNSRFSFLTASKLFCESMLLHTLKLLIDVSEVCFFTQGLLAYLKIGNIPVDEVISLKHPLKSFGWVFWFCFVSALLHMYFIWFGIFEWLLKFFGSTCRRATC